MERISAEDFYGQQSFISDYLGNPNKVDAFLPHHFRDDSAFASQAERLGKRSYDRQTLHTVLTAQNKRFGASQETFAHIDKMLSKDSVVVIGGQQAGLFGGPLYTLYKALSVLKLADHFGQKLARPVLPLFWIAADDHDFAEVNHTYLPDMAGEVQKLADEPGEWHDRLPVSQTLVSAVVADLITATADWLPDTEFSPDILAGLRQAYRPGADYAAAFASWMQHILQGYGLVMVDPSEPEIKALASDLFRQEILEHSPSSAAVMAQTDKLTAADYRSQLHLHEGLLNLFHHLPERDSLAIEGDAFRLKNANRLVTSEDLLAKLESEPENFSPNAALRPLFQDFIFPTLTTVLGPSEVAYFAQLTLAYERLDIPMPIAFPRCSVTVLEPRADRILRKYDISISELFVQREAILNQLVEREIPPSLLASVEQGAEKVAAIWQELITLSAQFDENMRKTAEVAQGRSLGQFEFIQKKIMQAGRKKDEVLRTQVTKLLNLVFPRSSPQERVFGLLPFYVRFGSDFIHQLYEKMDVFDSDHQIISF